MNVDIDSERCQGHARCWTICPEVFDLDEQGHAVITPPVCVSTNAYIGHMR